MGMEDKMSRYEFTMLVNSFVKNLDLPKNWELYYTANYCYIFEHGKNGKLIASLDYKDFFE